MADPPPTLWQRLGRHGSTLAVWGMVGCGLAMVVGFFMAVWLNILADAENPSPIFGKIAAGVFILFCAGFVVGVLGVALMTTQKKPAPPKKLRIEPEPEEEQESPADETPAEPAMPTRSWEDAFTSPHRRR